MYQAYIAVIYSWVNMHFTGEDLFYFWCNNIMLTLLWLHLLIKLCFFFLLFFSEIIMQIGLHSIIWKKYYLGEQNISFAFTSLFYFVVNAYILNFIFIQFVKCGFKGKSNFHSCSFVLVFFSVFPFYKFCLFETNIEVKY